MQTGKFANNFIQGYNNNINYLLKTRKDKSKPVLKQIEGTRALIY